MDFIFPEILFLLFSERLGGLYSGLHVNLLYLTMLASRATPSLFPLYLSYTLLFSDVDYTIGIHSVAVPKLAVYMRYGNITILVTNKIYHNSCLS